MKGNFVIKKTFLFLSIFIIVALACDLSMAVAPPTSPVALSTNTMVPAAEIHTQIPASTTPIPVTSAPEATSTAPVPAFEGVEAFYGPLRLGLPSGLASGVRGSQYSRVEGADVAPWDATPGHTQLDLDGYLLQGKFHQPRILVYPATGYGEMVPGAFESIHRLNNILFDPGAPVSNDQLPLVPFFSAGQVFASNIQVISFQNGRGVRFLTEYAQYAASANNQDLFYHFQGLTSDGVYYVIAILPITVPALAESSDGGAVLPQGGIPYPDITNPNADWDGYYNAVTALLNATSPQAFSPTLNQLDALIQSMRVGP
jgi:hypothetical protein